MPAKKKKVPNAPDSLLARLRSFLARRFPGSEPRDPSLEALQERIGYRFRRRELLDEALTHPSYAQQEQHKVRHNQRLEFLGDAVLSLILAERLYHDLPGEREGSLARARSALGKGELLAALARRLGLPACLRLADGDIEAGGRDWASSQEDAFEAMIGAVYLDSDYPTAQGVVLRWFGDLDELRAELLTGDNPKGRLQEWLAQRGLGKTMRYRLASTTGPDHAKVFLVELTVQDELLGQGEGRSKKEAEEQAARAALARLLERSRAEAAQQQ
ncbi:MAG: ribonuclease III [Opitutales bacterium]|jgi:ribonuclease-3